MSANRDRTVYVGNLDERVSERVLYDILIQAGRVVELYVPRDKETEKSKGYAFAEYETEEIANYAVRLFSGLVTLYNRTLKFAISGQDKSSSHTSAANPSQNLRPNRPESDSAEIPQNSAGLFTPGRASAYSDNHSHASVPTGMTPESNGFGSRSSGYEYSRRVFGATLESINHSRSRRHDTSNPAADPSY
ncbi:RNA-binding protein 7 [Rhodamnia argentea]|uniref:RNA-binding protein 7 n=1 Tax=Rhodamnia argentea TaxID=178133 RepID=A0A8B8NPY9_9MYRT|nr:RNA-binding protein 7 [Rhodamnia argentea]